MSKPFKCKIGLHQWVPVRHLNGASICLLCDLLVEPNGMKRYATVKDDGCVL